MDLSRRGTTFEWTTLRQSATRVVIYSPLSLTKDPSGVAYSGDAALFLRSSDSRALVVTRRDAWLNNLKTRLRSCVTLGLECLSATGRESCSWFSTIRRKLYQGPQQTVEVNSATLRKLKVPTSPWHYLMPWVLNQA